MLTGTEYAYMGTDEIIAGVYDWLFKEDSGILGVLPRKTVRDNGVKYNVESTYPSASWTDTDDEIPENAGAITQRSAAMYTLAQQINVDKAELAKDKTQNKEAVEIMRQSRGLLRKWQNAFIYGQTTTSSSTKQIKGLVRLLCEIESESTDDLDGAALATTGNNSQFVCSGDNTALTIAAVEVLEDAVKLGVNAYIMTRKTRRYLKTLIRASGMTVETANDKWEHTLTMWNGAPIYVSDHLGDNFPDASSSVLTVSTMSQAQAVGAGYDNTLILALNLSDGDGVHLIQSGDLRKEPRFVHPKKNAWVHRLVWDNVGLAVFNKYAIAGLFCLPAAS